MRSIGDLMRLGEAIGRAGWLLERAIKDAKDGQSVVVLNLKCANEIREALSLSADMYLNPEGMDE